jgi:hypothetical protein
MLKEIFLIFQLRISCGIYILYVASIKPLYHLVNTMVLNVAFSESDLDYHGSKIAHDLNSGVGGLVWCWPLVMEASEDQGRKGQM